MIVKFPGGIPTIETNATDRKILRQAEEKLRHAALVPGHASLAEVADTIGEFVAEQEAAMEGETITD